MHYPEGQLIRVGDLVWWNEGVCVGYVQSLMIESDEYESWGLDEPSIAFTNLHPFEANETKHPQNIGSWIGGGTVVDSIASLEDEGVGLLSDHEKSELEWATQEAVARARNEVRDLPYCVCACVDTETHSENCIFTSWMMKRRFMSQSFFLLEQALEPSMANNMVAAPHSDAPDPDDGERISNWGVVMKWGLGFVRFPR